MKPISFQLNCQNQISREANRETCPGQDPIGLSNFQFDYQNQISRETKRELCPGEDVGRLGTRCQVSLATSIITIFIICVRIIVTILVISNLSLCS